MHSGKVPMFKMQPHRAPLWLAIAVLLFGLAFFLEGHRDPGNLAAHDRSNLVLMVSVVVSGLLFIISTGRMWFKHLWHDRDR